jgi:hemerythrin superfamily protein
MDTKEIKILEAIAFLTYSNEHESAHEATIMQAWRELSLEDRQKWRDEAKQDLDILTQRGLRLVVQTPKKLDGFISDLVTRPAMSMYDPTKELTQTKS